MSDTLILVLRCLAACSSTMMILSPSRAVWRIHKTHDTGFTSIVSLVMTLANCHLWVLYGTLVGSVFPIIVTFSFGDVAALIYICIFWRWTKERVRTRKVLCVAGAFLAVTTAYTALGSTGLTHQSRDAVANVVGYIAIGVSIALYGSPLERVLQVLKYKSAVFIPIDMVVAGTVNNALWLAYTALDHYWFMFAPNVASISLGISSLVLYLVYDPKRCPYPRVDADVDAVLVVTPKEESAWSCSRDKFQIESPAFEAVHSPLAPPRV